ncbi:MAG: DUF4256 domain-containing protein [Bacteroidetes bacterium]|nr:MAG: DUF4256 domain-containing protein [Bacteroidota bacterium]
MAKKTEKKETKNAASSGDLMPVLEQRFGKNMARHKGMTWEAVRKALEKSPAVVKALEEMERSGGEPDVVSLPAAKGVLVFADCAAESPAGRRSICFDRTARVNRKEHPPKNSAEELAAAMGIALMTETEYRSLQEFGEFDLKTSSWVATPDDVRERGGALFCDRRYGRVFTYHNGADSYYAARGFRGIVKVKS